jgi:hypothetical protein
MRDRMIKVKVLSEEPFNEVIVNCFAFICRSETESAREWWEGIRKGAITKFENCFFMEEIMCNIGKPFYLIFLLYLYIQLHLYIYIYIKSLKLNAR